MIGTLVSSGESAKEFSIFSVRPTIIPIKLIKCNYDKYRKREMKKIFYNR